jgi:gas vesicle protein
MWDALYPASHGGMTVAPRARDKKQVSKGGRVVSDQDRSSESVLSLLAGIGLGALVGAMAALLLAPNSGAETRSQIRETADDVLGKLRESVDDLRGKVDEVIANTKQALVRRSETATDTESLVADSSNPL